MGAPAADATPKASTDSRADLRVRLGAGLLSVVVSTVLLGAKYLAYELTGSTAILSDAMESIVNVVAALFALFGLVVASRPADRNHPYGHGKIEFFSAAFEGGLIAFAAVAIIAQATARLLHGAQLREIGLGLAITAAAGLVNAGLGLFLVRTGRRYDSLTLVADGQHVLSDFWTSVGVVLGLTLVRFTGLVWIDPLVAALVGLNLAWTGWRLVRHAAGGLLDEEDPGLLEKLTTAFDASSLPGIIRVHNLRAMRAGRFRHVDAHLVMPEFWPVERAHEVANRFEAKVIETSGINGEIVFHIDPCRRAYCEECDVVDCAIRVQPFRSRPKLTLDAAVQPERPVS